MLCADAIVVPLAPDLFSLQGLRNLGPTLNTWRTEWNDRKERNPEPSLALPNGSMIPLGYVIMQFGIRDNRPVKAYDKWAQKIPTTYENYLLETPAQPLLDESQNDHCLDRKSVV